MKGLIFVFLKFASSKSFRIWKKTFERSYTKKYRRAISVVDGVDTFLVISSMGLGVTGVGLISTITAAPVVVALEAASLGCGLAGIAEKYISRKL